MLEATVTMPLEQLDKVREQNKLLIRENKTLRAKITKSNRIILDKYKRAIEEFLGQGEAYKKGQRVLEVTTNNLIEDQLPVSIRLIGEQIAHLDVDRVIIDFKY